MKRNFKKKTWEELKSLIDDTHSLDYIDRKNRYKVILKIGDTTFFTNLFKIGGKRPHKAPSTNDVDVQDFIDNYKLGIDTNPPVVKNEVKVDSNQLPLSYIDGQKLAVHSSTKPRVDNVTYAIWAGSGDNEDTGMICGGEILEFDLQPGKPMHEIKVKFDQTKNGRVWVHEGYLRFEGGGPGDYIDGCIVAEATPLQTSVNLDLVLDGDVIKYSASGPGTGTHGFADPNKVVLIPKSFSHDGDWDYDGTNLTPNFAGTGEYIIKQVECVVHKYITKIPCRGTCPTYFTMSSDETTELPANYYLKISAMNVSDTAWFASAIIEIYRERTFNP